MLRMLFAALVWGEDKSCVISYFNHAGWEGESFGAGITHSRLISEHKPDMAMLPSIRDEGYLSADESKSLLSFSLSKLSFPTLKPTRKKSESPTNS